MHWERQGDMASWAPATPSSWGLLRFPALLHRLPSCCWAEPGGSKFLRSAASLCLRFLAPSPSQPRLLAILSLLERVIRRDIPRRTLRVGTRRLQRIARVLVSFLEQQGAFLGTALALGSNTRNEHNRLDVHCNLESSWAIDASDTPYRTVFTCS